jgi:hypothetical protein
VCLITYIRLYADLAVVSGLPAGSEGRCDHAGEAYILGNCVWPLGAEDSCQPSISKKLSSEPNNLEKVNLSRSISLEVTFLPTLSFKYKCGSHYTLIAAL